MMMMMMIGDNDVHIYGVAACARTKADVINKYSQQRLQTLSIYLRIRMFTHSNLIGLRVLLSLWQSQHSSSLSSTGYSTPTFWHFCRYCSRRFAFRWLFKLR